MYSQKTNERLILASSSPRRREMLSAVGILFDVVAADIDESVSPDESAEAMVQRLALAKAELVSKQFPAAWILAADTTVTIDQLILGKPEDKQEAISMLRRLNGREHVVFSAFAICNLEREIIYHEVHSTQVRIVKMSHELIEKYVDSGEPLDKAGAYAIQGRGSALVDSVVGSYTNVVGINLSAALGALQKFGCLA